MLSSPDIRAVAVFCSARSPLPEAWTEAARQLGQWLGRHHKTLVYGGVAKGLMEVTAQAAKAAGAHIVGVVPTYMLCADGLTSTTLDECVAVSSLAERKRLLLARADAFVVLPGGVGTLDELFSVLAARQVGEHTKPVVVMNTAHAWDALVALLDGMQRHNLARPDTLSAALRVVASAEEL